MALVRASLEVRNEATARRVALTWRAHGRVCPHCAERLAAEAIELHVLLAHRRAFDVAAPHPLP